jgi:hypothetical protein
LEENYKPNQEATLNKNTKRGASEGVRRLSIAIGVLTALPWTFPAILIMANVKSEGGRVIAALAGYLACFYIGWGIVRSIAWIADGFRQKADSQEGSVEPSDPP